MPPSSSAGNENGLVPDPRTGPADPERTNPELTKPVAAERGRELMEKLLAFEAELTVLEHAIGPDRCLLWPIARWRLFDDAIADALQSPLPVPGRLGFSPARDLRYASSLLRRRPSRLRRRFDVLIFGSTLGVSVERDGKWFGRINDYFALEFEERSLVLDQSHQRTFREPRQPRHVAVHDAVFVAAAVRARIAHPAGRASAADDAAIARFVRFVREKMPGPPSAETLARLLRWLTAHASRARFLRSAYLRLFERTGAKIVFLEDASFATQAYILKWAHEAGLRSAEFQHGVIIPSVLAYNYGAPLRASAAYRPYLPEFLLTYGKFWSDNTHTASRLVEIGNPHFDLKRAELAGRARPTRGGRTLVIVSQADAAADLVPLARELRARLPPQDELVYRLHPAEVAAGEAYAALRGLTNLHISDSGDIYELLHDAGTVIGVSSTALFEAAGLGRPVHVYATPTAEFYVPRGFGTWFANCDELLAQLTGPTPIPLDQAHYFQPDWRNRFRGFMRDEIGVE